MDTAKQEKAPANNKKRKKIIIGVTAAVVVVAIIVVVVVVLMMGGLSRSAVYEINIGDSKAAVTDKLGDPAEGGDGDVWEYFNADDAEKGGAYNYAQITFQNDKVTRVVFNSNGENTQGKVMQAIALLTGSDQEDFKFFVSSEGEEANAYDIVYMVEYEDGSFSKDLVKSGVTSASAGTMDFEWTDAFGTKCTAGVRFTYPHTLQYIMNGGINAAGNIAGYSDEWMEKNGKFTLLDPAENAHEFTNISLNADGTVNCTVIEKEFQGWYSDSKFENKVTQITADDDITVLYAKWGGEVGKAEYKNEKFVRAADSILFGSYPQTLKAESVTISGSADANGYYTGSDGALYAAVQAKPHGNYDFKDGTGIKEGETYYFKVEPLLWRVIGDEDGTLTLLCNEIIYGMNFDSDAALWNESDIRQWLNGEFLENAFSQAQADMIAETQLNNGVTSVPVSATGSNTYVCENTSDKVWLLSYEEVQNTSYGFIGELAQGDGVVQGRDINRMKSVTDYAAACGALKIIGNSDYVGNGSWWLRSAYYGSTASELKVMDVRSDGYVGVYDSATLSAVGVAPAVRISIA